MSGFQGIYGGQDHIDWVSGVLTERATKADLDLNRDSRIEMFTKVLADPCDDAYLEYVFATIQKTFGDSQISDLVFWPGSYFGDGDHQRKLTPEMMADAVRERHAKHESK